MGSIHETHLEYVKALRARGEKVLKPKYREPMCRIEGYIKTQIPHKDVGAIFKDKAGKFGLFNDFGALHVTGICWEDLGLCDSRCWYEWMDTEQHEEKNRMKHILAMRQRENCLMRLGRGLFDRWTSTAAKDYKVR